MHRREALKHLGYGTLGLWLMPVGMAGASTPARAPALNLDGLDDLATRIRVTPRDEILELAAEARGDGEQRLWPRVARHHD